MPVDHTKTIIEVKDVSLRYGSSRVLSHINLSVHEGDYLGIIGPNGGGKTTLLKTMLGILAPDEGEVFLFGRPARAFRDRSKIGYVAQKATSFDPLFPATARDVVAMGRYGARGLCHPLTSEDQRLIDRALDAVDILQLRDRMIGDLSGGEQQRVFIARAIASEPSVIFLDEPTVGVDVRAQEQFYLLLKRLNTDLGITLVLVSHDIDVVASEATELACINQTLIYHGVPRDFIAGDYMEKLYGRGVRQIVHGH